MYSQSNIESLFEMIGRSSGQKFIRTKYYDYIQTKDSAWPNQLFNFKPSVEESSQLLEKTEESCAKGLIPNLLMCNPVTDNAQVINSIKSRGYKQGGWTAMTHDLNFDEQDKQKIDLGIGLVESLDQMGTWLDIVEQELMGGHRLNPQIFYDLLESDSCHFYLGYVEGVPVSTAMLFTANKEGGIYLVSTRQSHRKRGFGSQITHKCLLEAKAMNCNEVHIQATDAGRSVYKSLGFREHGLIHVFRIEK